MSSLQRNGCNCREGEKMSEFYFFWSGPFSQWAMVDITIDGKIYNCNEQYMMSQKALFFDDRESYNDIMKSDDPAEQKAIGRKIKNFDKEKWEKVARDIVYAANYAKFTQSFDMLLKLYLTEDKIIVEASPEDIVWGIGLRATDRRALDTKQWKGTNWLGEAIMKVRKKIDEEGYFDEFRKKKNNF
jgi:ribA/ribD-fused uncharacterized protein